jgi:hypothetical protein
VSSSSTDCRERLHERRRPFLPQLQHGFQRQRLIAARAFFSRRAVIFFDLDLLNMQRAPSTVRPKSP